MPTRFDELIHLAFALRAKKGFLVGLELEYENYQQPVELHPPMKYWKTIPDYSLRSGGIEYVSKPLPLKESRDAIEEMITDAVSSKLKATSRCGLHVHVNMLDRTFRDVYLVSVLYTLLEPYIFEKFAPHRKNSHFCVPVYANTALVDTLHTDNMALRAQNLLSRPSHKQKKPKPWAPPAPAGLVIPEGFTFNPGINYQHIIYDEMGNIPALQHVQMQQNELPSINLEDLENDPIEYAQVNPWAAINHDGPLFPGTAKYSALNYSALKKYGTLEYRQHPSTLDSSAILLWVDFLKQLHQSAYTWNDPLTILETYETIGPLEFVQKVKLPLEDEVTNNAIDLIDIEDAIDSATLIAGHSPVSWQELKWEIK